MCPWPGLEQTGGPIAPPEWSVDFPVPSLFPSLPTTPLTLLAGSLLYSSPKALLEACSGWWWGREGPEMLLDSPLPCLGLASA